MKKSERIAKLLTALQEEVYEKDTVFRLALLAMLAGESIFLLGRPGVAKSLISRRLKYAFKDGASFEYLMNRFSSPEELFGPISIKALQQGSYARLIDNYLPTADIVFLDEIWKASPSIQNTLLTIINEKIFRNAGQDINVPMKLLIAASNELPAEGEGLEALFDRFVIRYVVQGVSSEKSFNKLVASNTSLEVSVDPELKMTNEDYATWMEEIKKIKVSDVTFNFISRFRQRIADLTKNTAYISDRRWKKIVHLMKASALFNDRTTVDKPDWLIIGHCIWDNENQRREYVKIFHQFYVENITYEYKTARQEMDTEIAAIKKSLAELNSEDILRQEYTNIFENAVKGRFHRIISSDLPYPITFIGVNAFNKIRRNGYAIATIYMSDDLANLKEKQKITLNFVSEQELQNSDSEAKYRIEVANSSNSQRIKSLQKQIVQLQERIAELNADIQLERKRLLKAPAVFFQEQMELIINQAFRSEEIPLDLQAFQDNMSSDSAADPEQVKDEAPVPTEKG